MLILANCNLKKQNRLDNIHMFRILGVPRVGYDKNPKIFQFNLAPKIIEMGKKCKPVIWRFFSLLV
jgi:hypothetical protein